MTKITGRSLSYFVVGVSLFTGCFFLRGVTWLGSSQLHTIMEAIATFLAFMVGGMALVRYYSKLDNTFLIIGAGFLGTGFLDGYHAIVTSVWFISYFLSDPNSLSPWSWIASRLFLSGVVFYSWLDWRKRQSSVVQYVQKPVIVYATMAAFTLISFLVFAFSPLPAAYYPKLPIHRPAELVPAIFFALALLGYLRKGLWRSNCFEHWLVLALIVNLAAQTAFMPCSGQLYDVEFDVAHLLKKASYICVLTGLFINMYQSFKRIQREITVRKSAESALKYSELRLRAVIDTVIEGIITIDAKGHIETLNPAAIKIFGYAADEVVGQNVKMLMPEPYQSEHDGYLRHYQQTGVAKVIGIGREVKGLRKDGSVFSMELAVSEMEIDGKRMFTGLVRDITQQKLAQAALANNEARFRAVIDTVLEGIITIDSQGVVETINPAAIGIFGYQADEVIGQNIKMLMPEPYHSEHDGYLRHYKETGEKKVIGIGREVLGRRKDGSVFPMELAVSEMNIDGKQMFTGLVRDITQIKKTEELRSQLSAIIESSDDAIISKSLDGIISSWNSAAEKMFGYSAKEAIGQSMSLIIPPERIDEEPNILNQVIRGEPIEHFETVRVRKDGRRIFISATISPIKDKSGRILGISKIARDITEQIQTQRDIKSYSQRLELATSSGGIGVWEYNFTDGALIWDERMFELYGISAQHFPGTYEAWQSALHPEDSEKAEAELNSAINGEQDFNTEFRIILPDSTERTLKAAALVVKDEAGKPERMIGINSDITEQKQIERMKNEFISTVSHELRTPLTSIQGALGLILGGATGELPEQSKKLLEIANNNSSRLIRLINDILDIEKIEAGKIVFNLKPVEVMPLVQQTIDSNQAYASNLGVDMVLTEQAPDTCVLADQDRLIQVLTNLLSNAAKFSFKDQPVEIAVRQTEQTVRFSVTNTGLGISEAFKKSIFGKFSQADASNTRQKGGTGLGLHICKVIVEKLGGQIGFESEINKKTCFFFDLPIWNPVPGPELAVENPQQQGHLLLLEDDVDIANLLRLMLEKHQYQVDIAYNADQARELLEKNQYDAMTLDLMLPGQNGIEFFKALRQQAHTRDLPVVVVSAIAEKGQQELNGDAVSIIDWLDKPIDEKRLEKAIALALRKNGSLSRILHIEDDPDIVHIVSTLMQGIAQIDVAGDLKQARQKLQQAYDLVILDMSLPDGSGASLLPELSSREPPLPVVVFSAQDVDDKDMRKVTANFVKSKTSTRQLIDAIESILATKKTGHK